MQAQVLSAADARCDASRSMRARASSPVLILRDARTRVRVCGNTPVCALLRMRTNIACCKVHHTNSPSPPRGAFAAARAGWSDPCIFLFFCRFGIFHRRSHDLKHTHTSSFPRRMSAPGVLHPCFTDPERGVGGAPRNVRVQRHPLGVHMTRARQGLARRLASHDAANCWRE